MSKCKFKASDGECLRDKMFPYKEYCVNGPCPHYTAQTNADHIRSMTDEEIENWFWWMHKEMMYYTDSHAFVHEWLKQEVET